MRRTTLALALLSLVAGAATMPAAARAMPAYYTSQSCNACHGSTATCKGCHHHALPVNVTADKATYAPGETISVTVTSGGQSGWARAAILDGADAVVAQVAGATFPVAMTAAAPSTPGTYTWKGAWYGNGYESGGAIGGAGFVADPNNADHGWQPVAFTFTVSAPPSQDPTASLSATSLDFGAVTVGQSRTLSAEVRNTGAAALSVTAVTPCSNTSPPYAISPAAAFSVAAGGAQALSVTFSPTSSGAAPGCFDLATNDPAHPTLRLSVSGSGASVPTPSAALTPTSLAFGSVTVGQASTLTAQVGNTGTGTLTVSGVTTCDGSSSPAFTVTPVAAFTVAPAVTQTLTVRFAPTAAGAATGCFRIATDDAAHPALQLQVSGTGADPTPPPPPPSQTCGSCHAIPPATGRHALHRREDIACSRCHGTGYSNTTVNSTTHGNGRVEVASSAGWNTSRRSCSNSCHGSETWGGSGGTAPPPSGTCGSCHAIPPATGRHATHRSENVACSRCHGAGYSNTAVNAATHQNNTVELASSAGWNTSRRSCSNSCHGTESWGGTSNGGGTPPGTCGSCHAIPPASGEHATHRSEGVSCSRCHGAGYSNTAFNAATHGNGRVEIASTAGWRASSRSCSNSCHGGESWGSSSGDGDDDGDGEDDEDLTVNASKADGGCSSAGAPLTAFAFAGLALLGALRRRRR